MPLLAESGDPLLTESGETLLTEDETGIPGLIGMRVRAKLKLAVNGALSGINTPVSIQGKAALKLAVKGALSGVSTPDWKTPIVTLAGAIPFMLTEEGPEGSSCFRSGAITDNGISQARFIAPSNGIFTVWFKVSSESNYDWLTARKVGAPDNLFRVSGTMNWQNATVVMAEGDALDVFYEKDSSVFSGADAGWFTISFESDACEIKGKAALSLAMQGALSGATIAATSQPLQGRATLKLAVSNAKISKPQTLQGRATLQLIARNGTIAAPTGLTALMKVITDSARPEVVLDQYLLVWFNGHPGQCQIALALDEGTPIYPTSTWMNPGTTGPSILKIDSAEIPGDGYTHKVTVSVRVNSHGQTGPWSTTAIYAKTPKPRTTDQPEWCEAVLLRQGGSGATAPLADLTRIRWRHDGAVKIMARIPVLVGAEPRRWSTREIDVGYADYDETEFIAEGIGLRLEYFGGQFRNVEFGVCAIDRGSFGPVRWSMSPISIKELDPDSSQEEKPPNPDQQKGTLTSMAYSQFKNAIAAEIREKEPGWSNSWYITITALDQTLLTIKDIVRKGGRVTLNDFGAFEARWNADHTVRSVAFVPSVGFKEGVRQGRILTDDQAKAG